MHDHLLARLRRARAALRALAVLLFIGWVIVACDVGYELWSQEDFGGTLGVFQDRPAGRFEKFTSWWQAVIALAFMPLLAWVASVGLDGLVLNYLDDRDELVESQ